MADVDSGEEAELRRLDGKQPIAPATGPRGKKSEAMHAAPAAASAAAPSAAPSAASREDLLTLGGASSSTLTDRRLTRQRNVCATDGCATFARRQSAGSTCAKHGGGKRCEEPDCNKSARGDTGACIAHGGGKRCEEPDCNKSALGDTGACAKHGPRCENELYKCPNGQSRSGAAPTLCIRHGGGLTAEELRDRDEQRARQEVLKAQQREVMARGYRAPTPEEKAEAAALFNSPDPRLWSPQIV